MFNMIDKSTFDPPGDTTSPLPSVLDGSFWDFARNEWPWGHSNSEVEEAEAGQLARCCAGIPTSGFRLLASQHRQVFVDVGAASA
jgi:hypothetical protein